MYACTRYIANLETLHASEDSCSTTSTTQNEQLYTLRDTGTVNSPRCHDDCFSVLFANSVFSIGTMLTGVASHQGSRRTLPRYGCLDDPVMPFPVVSPVHHAAAAQSDILSVGHRYKGLILNDLYALLYACRISPKG